MLEIGKRTVQRALSALTILMITQAGMAAEDLSKLPLDEILQRDYVGELPAESHQYDFLIGEWDIEVTSYDKDGKASEPMKGIWWSKYLHGGRVFFDDVVLFDGGGKLYPGFPSLRTYSPKLGGWVSMHMSPLATQALCSNVGTWKNGEMHINSKCLRDDGSVQSYSRIRFYNITNTYFDYKWEESTDGATWRTYATFIGNRRP